MTTEELFRVAARRGWSVRWEDDWEVRSHVAEYGDCYDVEPTTCETALLVDEDGDVLACLGCVDDASGDYRREIEAGLMADALADCQGVADRFFAGLVAS